MEYAPHALSVRLQLGKGVLQRVALMNHAVQFEFRGNFQMLAEQMRDSVAIVAEGTAHNTSRLDDHEGRLKAIEKLRRS